MPSSTQVLNSLYDTTVESKPVWTNHAKQRLNEGRKGDYVCKRKKNKTIIVTVLPSGSNHDIPSIQYRRKENSKMYKYKNNK